MMTRQHYNLIARVIRELPINSADRAMITREFVPVLKADNPRFDAERFRKACESPMDKE